jgi:hypothetical protein
MLNWLRRERGHLLTLRPQARTTELLMTEVDDEVVIYDTIRRTGHALNPIAALVWQHCDGHHTVRDLAALVPGGGTRSLGEDVVWLSLRQLAGADLLDASTPLPQDAPRVTRAGLLRAGMASGAVLLPVVASIAVPTAAHAQSCASNGESCASIPCCIGCACIQNFCVCL